MAYALRYTSTFKQVYSQYDIVINIYKKDYSGDSEVLNCTGFKVLVSGNEKKNDCIISHKATISFFSDLTDTINNETFVSDYYDLWKVEATVDGVNIFTGFIEPSEQGYRYGDRPYDVEITCTDGIGLLKTQPIKDINDNDFYDKHLIIDYIAGILSKTGLELPIRVYCNLFLDYWMNDRGADPSNCMFHLAKLNHRTFLKSSSEYMNCYDALEAILYGFKIFQSEDKWIISYIGEYVESEGPTTYYTDYDSSGAVISSGFDDVPPFPVGKYEFTQPVTANHLLSHQNAIVSAKVSFDYTVPDNLVANQNLEKVGLPYYSMPVTGTESYWRMYDWSDYHKDLQNEESFMGSGYITQVTNADGFIIDKYYTIPFRSSSDPDGLLRNYIRHNNNDFNVSQGDILSISVSWKLRKGPSPRQGYANLMVIGLKRFGSWFWLKDDKTWVMTPACAGRVDIFPEKRFFLQSTVSAEPINPTEWQTLSVDDFIIPYDGELYICLGAKHDSIADGEISYFKDIKIDYNGNEKKKGVKGDYWMLSQNKNIKDTIDEKIALSDSPKPIVKGTIWESLGLFPSNGKWHKSGQAEMNHYKYFVTTAQYQMYHRRFKRINGAFRGTLARNDSGSFRLPFHKHFTFANEPASKMFLLCGPLTIDYMNNQFDGTFVEVSNGNDNAVGDNSQFKYIY